MKLWNKDIIIIIIIGLIIRLILLPYTQVIHADAISRITQAMEWLEHPKYIVGAVWGPLNQYLYAFSIKFLGGKIYGPKIINILFAVFTVYPLYHFSFNIFKVRSGSAFVALVYVLSPLVLRNSFQALPAVPYAFFVALTMYYLSEFLKDKKILYLVLSAIAINLAGALRYEAWIISFLFGIILLLNKQYRSFFLFGGIALLFPLSWLIGNQVLFNDWFYSFHYSTEWAIKEIKGLDVVSKEELVIRILFFPFSMFIVFSPLVLALISYIIPVAFLKKRCSLNQIIWIIPFLVLFAFYVYKIITGTLLLQHKYTITLFVLLLPFAALIFKDTKNIIKGLAILSVLAIIPLSFTLNKIPWKSLLSFSQTLSTSVNVLFVEHYQDPNIYPKLRDVSFSTMVKKSNQAYKDGDGVVTDFLGWKNTYYFSLHSIKTPYTISGILHDQISFKRLDNYFIHYPTGLIIFNYFGRLLPLCEGNENKIKIGTIKNVLQLKPIRNSNGFMLFRYNLLVNNSSTFLSNENSIIKFKKDVDYYKIKIKRNKLWYNSLKEQAKKENKSIKEIIQSNAEYCYKMKYN